MTRTPKSRALGNALRQAREDQGVSLRAFASRINRDPGVLSRWENGERTPKPEHVAQFLTALGLVDERYDQIVSLAYRCDEPLWVATTLPEQRQQLAALVDNEKNASKITVVSPLLVPGLLQTPDYIRAMMEDGGVSSAEIDNRVATRIRRQEILKRKPKPVELVAFVGDAALRQMIRSWDIVVGQLRYLLEVARRPNIDLRVIPYNRGWHPALEGFFTLIESDKAPRIVHLENRRSGLFLHEDDDVSIYIAAVDQVRRVALTPEESTTLIAGMIDRMGKYA